MATRLGTALAAGTHGGRLQLDALIGHAKREAGDYAIPTVTSGAIDPDQAISNVSSTGAQAFTLANGTYVGQRVYLRCTVATGAGTLTPATPRGFATAILDAAGEQLWLVWTGSLGWAVDGFVGTTFT